MDEEARKQKKKARARAYYLKNREKLAAQQKAYYEANKDKLAERQRVRRETNRDKVAEDRHAYYEANKGKIAEYKRAYRERNKSKFAEDGHAYYEANKEKLLEYGRVYRMTRTPNEAFRTWMQETGTTQTALAEKIGVTPRTISNWYTGTSPINMQKLRAALPTLADFLEDAAKDS